MMSHSEIPLEERVTTYDKSSLARHFPHNLAEDATRTIADKNRR